MNNPAISVVMPVYNGEKYLSEAIESILNQTFANFEFIIVYDKSQDESLEIIRRYMKIDERIKLIELDNKGLVYSLNIGIDMAKGKYIARMDADDISLPERFELQYNYMENNLDVAILGTYIEVLGEYYEANTKIEKWFNDKLNDENVHIKTIYGCPVAHPTVMMRTEFARTEKYSDFYDTMEDYDLWIRAIKKGCKISNINKVLLNYRVHNESKSNTERDEIAIKQRIDCKLRHFFDSTKKNVLVWGAGLGGRIFVDFIQSSKWNDKINIITVVDKVKKGNINSIGIVSPYEIQNIEHDYIFITTCLGYREVSDYLEKSGLELIEDYLYPI